MTRSVAFSRTRCILLLLAVTACAPRPPGPPVPRGSVIDTLALRGHTSFLADDLLQGRATGSPGADLAALYIAAQCRALGLRPPGGAYHQDVPLDEIVLRSGETRLTIGGQSFGLFDDFLVTSGTEQTLRGFRGALVIIGTAEDVRRDADRLPALDGQVAVIAGVARADVAAILARRGAAGIIQVIGDAEGYGLYAASRGQRLTVLRDSAVISSFYPELPAVLVGPTVLPALRGPGAVAELVIAFDRRPIGARNVACLLPGTHAQRRDTVVAFTAHYDHLGISLPDPSGDSVYNGFSDNAAGVAMLLAIAGALQKTPDRALETGALFLFFTGEERGLLGSDYFVAHPTFPLDRIRAVINLDAGAPAAAPWTWRIAGGEGNPLGTLATDVAATRGWSVTLSPATANSDYFPFARVGVPAMFIIPGSAPYEGLSADSSQALRKRWDRYHQAGDAYYEAFPFTGLQRYAEFAFLIAEALGGRRRPVR